MCASRNHLFSRSLAAGCPFVGVNVPLGSESKHDVEWSVLDSCDESSIELNTYPVVEE